MALIYAKGNGNWSSTSTWGGGVLPVAGDEVYTNSFTVAIDTDIDVDRISNDTTPIGVVGCPIPIMTSYTTPSGIVTASSELNTNYAYKAFDKNPNTGWYTNGFNTGWLAYQFPTGKVIKQYSFNSINTSQLPKNFTFEGSNGGGVWDILHTVTNNILLSYNSGVISNSTSYTSYRINITAVGALNNYVNVRFFDMTESTNADVSSYKSAGGVTITGSRNINFSGQGFLTFNTNNTCIINSTSGSTVNFTTSGSGYVLGPNQQRGSNIDLTIISIPGSATVNFTCDLWGFGTGIYNIGYSRVGMMNVNGAATVNVIGNIYSSRTTIYSCPVILLSGSTAKLNITGNVVSDGISRTRSGVSITGVNTVTTIIGNLEGVYGNCVSIVVNGTAQFNHIGTVSILAANSMPAIMCDGDANTAVVKVTSPIINLSNRNAISTHSLSFYNTANIQWTVQDDLGTNKILTTSGGSSGVPLESDVRDGITYGVGSSLTGTLVIPSASNVRVGVPFDDTVGTADLTAQDFFTAIATSTDPIAVRMRNSATVQTVASTIASFDV